MQVVFDGTQLEAGSIRDFHDCISVTSESGNLELPVHARPPKPQLHVEGDLQFGMLGVDSKHSKQLLLANTGPVPADFRVEWDK